MTGFAEGDYLYPTQDIQDLKAPDVAQRLQAEFENVYAQLRKLATSADTTGADGDDGPPGPPGRAGNDGDPGRPGPPAPTTLGRAPLQGFQAPGSFAIASGKFGLHGKRLKLTGTQRGTVLGTARLVISG